MKSGLYYINACPSSPLHEPDPQRAPEGPAIEALRLEIVKEGKQ